MDDLLRCFKRILFCSMVNNIMDNIYFMYIDIIIYINYIVNFIYKFIMIILCSFD